MKGAAGSLQEYENFDDEIRKCKRKIASLKNKIDGLKDKSDPFKLKENKLMKEFKETQKKQNDLTRKQLAIEDKLDPETRFGFVLMKFTQVCNIVSNKTRHTFDEIINECSNPEIDITNINKHITALAPTLTDFVATDLTGDGGLLDTLKDLLKDDFKNEYNNKIANLKKHFNNPIENYDMEKDLKAIFAFVKENLAVG